MIMTNPYFGKEAVLMCKTGKMYTLRVLEPRKIADQFFFTTSNSRAGVSGTGDQYPIVRLEKQNLKPIKGKTALTKTINLQPLHLLETYSGWTRRQIYSKFGLPTPGLETTSQR